MIHHPDNLDYLFSQPGIEAVLSVSGDSDAMRGDADWAPILRAGLDLLNATTEPKVRILIGKQTLVAFMFDDEQVSLVHPTGHGIAKSLQRMLRRLAREGSENRSNHRMRKAKEAVRKVSEPPADTTPETPAIQPEKPEPAKAEWVEPGRVQEIPAVEPKPKPEPAAIGERTLTRRDSLDDDAEFAGATRFF